MQIKTQSSTRIPQMFTQFSKHKAKETQNLRPY